MKNALRGVKVEFIVYILLLFVLLVGNASAYSQMKLIIPTYDGSGQCVHPDIYYNSSEVFGFKYWMVFTPYPYGNSVYENPSLVCSQDGINWRVPPNIRNPIDPFPGTGKHDADTDLVYNPTDGKLYIYYVEIDPVIHLKLRTFNGKKISPEINVNQSSVFGISPAVLIDNGTFYLYSVNASNVWLSTSTDGVNFSNTSRIKINSIGRDVWHIEVEKYGNKLVELVTCVNNRTAGTNASLYLGISKGFCSQWILQKFPVLAAKKDTWYNGRVYRSTEIVNSKGIDVWFSASSASKVWGIGKCKLRNVDGIWQATDVSSFTKLPDHFLDWRI